MWTQDRQVVAAGHSVDRDRWQLGLDEVLRRIAGRFVRVEPRRHASAFVVGLLAGLPRVNCWSIAEHAGFATPDGLQHLLSRASWDHDGVREDLRGYVLEHLADPDAVLVVDETGDVKKGAATVGVQRQYTGTAGRVENAQVAVYLVYAAAAGQAFIDRALYLPAGWADDPSRRRVAGVPADVQFATKPALARAMLDRALDAGTPTSWVTADEVYGQDPALRADLIGRGVGYVLAVAATSRIRTGASVHSAAQIAAAVPAAAWNRVSAGLGAKGHRVYHWALTETTDPADPHPGAAGRHWLLIRRSIRTGELAFYRAHTPSPVPLATLVRVAGRRWSVEEAFQSGKELTGLDEHQVRTWTSWHRWTVLAMLAHAFLTVMAATTPTAHDTSDADLTRLTRNEIRRLFSALTVPARTLIDHAAHCLNWSHWRRRHQARARACHYRRQATLTT